MAERCCGTCTFWKITSMEEARLNERNRMAEKFLVALIQQASDEVNWSNPAQCENATRAAFRLANYFMHYAGKQVGAND